MKSKKLLAGSAALVLLLSLCSCSVEKEKPSAPDTKSDYSEMQTAKSDGTTIPDDLPVSVMLVNLKGDTVTVTLQQDGSYSDGKNTYFFDGTDTWKDSNGTEWNEAVPYDDGGEAVTLVNLKGDTVTVTRQQDGSYSDGTDTYIFDGVDTWKDSSGAEWNEALNP